MDVVEGGGGGEVLFPKFEVPFMTAEIEATLTEDLEDGKVFRDIWKRLFDNPDTVPLHTGKVLIQNMV